LQGGGKFRRRRQKIVLQKNVPPRLEHRIAIDKRLPRRLARSKLECLIRHFRLLALQGVELIRGDGDLLFQVR
jgi:hypothetical protein